MSKIVFILGAGASAEGGAPVMRNFLDVARDLLAAKSLSEEDAAAFQHVFESIGKLQAVFAKSNIDLDNLESVFNAFEMGKIIERLPGREPTDIDKSIASLVRLIVSTLEHRMMFPEFSDGIAPPQPYGRFAKLLLHLAKTASPRVTSAVITFNYDIAADYALAQQNELNVQYGLAPDQGGGLCVPLLKLHGSLNWAMSADGRSITPFNVKGYSWQRERDGYHCRIGSELKARCERLGQNDVRAYPVIVPPSWNKSTYHSAISSVWVRAAKELSDAEQIHVVGFSLPPTDEFFKLLYALGSVGPNLLRKFAVYDIDPAEGIVDQRFRELLGKGALGRYEYNKMPFREAIGKIGRAFDFKE